MSANKPTYLFFTLTLFCSYVVLAEQKLCIIVDPDGYSNIRSGPGNEFPVVGIIKKGEFFYCDLNTSEWINVTEMTWRDGSQLQGYIHRSRVESIEMLDIKKQKEILITVLNKQKELAETFQKMWRSKDSVGYKSTILELERHSAMRYSPVLSIFSQYFCRTRDSDVLRLFYETMWADKGSADESPSVSISQCFICDTDLVIRQLSKLNSIDQKKSILDQIEFGLLGHFAVDDNGESENKEFNNLKLRLDHERKIRP